MDGMAYITEKESSLSCIARWHQTTDLVFYVSPWGMEWVLHNSQIDTLRGGSFNLNQAISKCCHHDIHDLCHLPYKNRAPKLLLQLLLGYK